jgi:hypothetical protein
MIASVLQRMIQPGDFSRLSHGMCSELDATYLGHSPKPQVKGWLLFGP